MIDDIYIYIQGEHNPQQNQNNQIFFHCSMAAMFWLDSGNNDAAVHKTKLHSRKYIVKLCGKYGWAAFKASFCNLLHQR